MANEKKPAATAAPAAPAAETTAAPVVPISNEAKLATLKTDYKSAWSKMAAAEPGTPEGETAAAEVWKIKGLIKAAEQAIENEANAAKLAEARNQRVAMFDNAVAAALSAGTDSEAFKGLREAVVNELLAKFGTATKATTTASTSASTGERGATGKRIREAFIANRAAGMNDTDNAKAIIASGESRGTTGAVILAYQREIGEKS